MLESLALMAAKVAVQGTVRAARGIHNYSTDKGMRNYLEVFPNPPPNHQVVRFEFLQTQFPTLEKKHIDRGSGARAIKQQFNIIRRALVEVNRCMFNVVKNSQKHPRFWGKGRHNQRGGMQPPQDFPDEVITAYQKMQLRGQPALKPDAYPQQLVVRPDIYNQQAFGPDMYRQQQEAQYKPQ
ncbi:hypothetical protein B7494_g1302 [Chlorociboria aeruginascens]|nr:hypothetical protein B7494_g1302 [Chlorociboria aeruginascens]